MSPLCVFAIFSALLCSTQGYYIKALFEEKSEEEVNSIEADEFAVSTLLERANIHVGEGLDEPLVMYGDIAVKTGLQNADPCTAKGCKWPKAADGNVYVPFTIAKVYSSRESSVILDGLNSFAVSTCVRFIPRTTQRDFVDIQCRSGCYSYVGRQGSGQVVSLARNGCVFRSVVQHELLHALGFDHEQTRSDRDQNVRILLENVIPGQEHNFRKINTNNLGTPYDYNSVMHYSRYAFSKNREPTIIPIPDNNVVIGRATQMSPMDIMRINLLYNCNRNMFGSIEE
ncbi:low choriolytic enzyme-like [Hypomesus transpacificus]|uniref:low choriolytic enzyme-like n=1 Tax=Hypomesus transpacificus TaxID=137520 RepID=UPI001F07FE74|nr:low choriolytic enzyme-like [Hypomesus transpacificus]